MAKLKINKVNIVPTSPEANSVYLVKVGSEFELYVSDDEASVSLYPLKHPSIGAASPDFSNMVTHNFTADVNDWVRPATSSGYNITTDGNNYEMTGIVAPSTQEGFWFFNGDIVNEKKLKLKHDDTNSSVNNRFYLPDRSDLEIRPGEGVYCTYNTIISRWVIIQIDR